MPNADDLIEWRGSKNHSIGYLKCHSGRSKPLYYVQTGQTLAFASEIKVLLEERIVNLRAQWQETQRTQSLAAERIDITIPGTRRPRGSLHPLFLRAAPVEAAAP